MKTLPDGTLLSNLEDRCQKYQEAFWEDPVAQGYMRQRGFTDESLRNFRIGSTSPGRDRLDGRIMFPIFSASGELVGFSGRDYTGAKGRPKYLNSSSDEGFDKGKHLFGINLAREAIFLVGKAILVEGFTDVMAMHQVGIKNVVAPMSTTMTDSHMGLVGRYCKEMIFLFDQDQRGRDSMRKAMEKARSYGFKLSTVSLPEGQDPADYYLNT